MIRGTTPVITFSCAVDPASFQVFYITFKQIDRVVIEKSNESCTVSGMEIITQLTQEETLKLHADSPVRMQIRAKTTAGKAVASDIIVTTVDEILKDGVI